MAGQGKGRTWLDGLEDIMKSDEERAADAERVKLRELEEENARMRAMVDPLLDEKMGRLRTFLTEVARSKATRGLVQCPNEGGTSIVTLKYNETMRVEFRRNYPSIEVWVDGEPTFYSFEYSSQIYEIRGQKGAHHLGPLLKRGSYESDEEFVGEIVEPWLRSVGDAERAKQASS